MTQCASTVPAAAAARVAILGAGAAGCSIAAVLAKSTRCNVTLFDMGRGVGGRLAARGSRSLPGLEIEHGASAFYLSEATRSKLAMLAPSFVLEPWSGRHVTLTEAWSPPSEAQLAPSAAPAHHFRAGGALCAALLASAGEPVRTRFGTQVLSLEQGSGGWRLGGKHSGDLGEYDWLVVTSHTAGHARWRTIFGTEPPLASVAARSGDAGLAEAVERCASTLSAPAFVAMLAVADDCSHPDAARWGE